MKKKIMIAQLVMMVECLALAILLILVCVTKKNATEKIPNLASAGEEEKVSQQSKPKDTIESEKQTQTGKTDPTDPSDPMNPENPLPPSDTQRIASDEQENDDDKQEDDADKQEDEDTISTDSKLSQEWELLLEKANLSAAMYDYDKAIELIKSQEGYENAPLLTEALASYEKGKSELVVWEDNTHISHIFFHSLIVDTSLAFGPNSGTRDGYNQYMTTVEEFNKILQQMYDRGYVLISIHDMAEIVIGSDGSEQMVMKKILLPKGKIPFVMSQDDVNYYDYMDNEGFATKIVIGEDGKPTCEYRNVDGSVVTGDYDLVPLLDRFIEAHPDFSYHGAKAILAVTGYEGALGYETAPYRYDEEKHLVSLSKSEKDAMLESEREKCKEVVANLKADGFEFASHSYGHGNMQTNSVEKYRYDMNRWLQEVGILVGDTDVYIYPFGADICDWHGYQGEKYQYAIACGFRFFCNVDSAQYWVQRKADYLRQGRINFDGERMMKTPEKLTYFYDVDSVLDPTRPPLRQ